MRNTPGTVLTRSGLGAADRFPASGTRVRMSCGLRLESGLCAITEPRHSIGKQMCHKHSRYEPRTSAKNHRPDLSTPSF